MNGSICKFNKKYLYPMSREYLLKLKDWRNMQMDVLRQWKPLTEYNQENWFQLISQDNTQVVFAIMEIDEKDNMKFIGYCGITNIDFVNRHGEVSFLVDPARRENKELYREDFLATLFMLCKYGFENLNLHKMYTETYIFREYHIKILEEFGLHPGGILKEHKFINGEYVDSIIHHILQNTWSKTKEEIRHVLER